MACHPRCEVDVVVDEEVPESCTSLDQEIPHPMKFQRSWSCLTLFAAFISLLASGTLASGQASTRQNSGDTAGTSRAPAAHDGQYDFDFLFGSWRSHARRLQRPLTGSKSWIQKTGTEVVRKVWGGRALLDEIEANGPDGLSRGLTLFLYNPQSHQWSVYFSNSNDGTIGLPTIGEFRNGRGEFYDQETYNGKTMLVRVVWSNITPTSHRFEQSFSDDGGKTWEPSFVAELTKDDSVQPAAAEHEDQKRAQHDNTDTRSKR